MSAIASVTNTGLSSIAASSPVAGSASSSQQTGASSAISNAYTLSDTLSALLSGNSSNSDTSDSDTITNDLITQYQQATGQTYSESQYLQALQSGTTSASTSGSQSTSGSSSTSDAYTLSASLKALISANEKSQQSSFVQMLTGTSDSDSSDAETEDDNLITQYEQATNVTYPELQYLQTMQSGTTAASTSAADTTATTASTNTSSANTSPSIGSQVDVSV